MNIGKMLVGLCLGLALAGLSCEEANRTPEAHPPAATQAAPQTTTTVNDEAAFEFGMEERGHIVTMMRLVHDFNEISDKVDAALDSGNCNQTNFMLSGLAPRLVRTTDQISKEDAWFAAAKNDPRNIELARSGMGRDISPELMQVTAQVTAFRNRAENTRQRLDAAVAACGSLK